MKLTKHRKEILEHLTTCHEALSAREIHKHLPHINLVTIYRNLELFATLGMIRKLYLDGNEAVFEYQIHPHHHAVCTDCNEVRHIDIDPKKLKQVLKLTDFDVSDVEIVVRGTCRHKHTTD